MLSRFFTTKIKHVANATATATAVSVRRCGFHDVVIVSYARTPITTFLTGGLNTLTGPTLASFAITQAIEKANATNTAGHNDVKGLIEEVYLGNVVSAGIGQAPTRQAVLQAGLASAVPCTTINKVCASGMKAIALAAQNIMLGQRHVMIAGGFESMSNVPYYLPNARQGYRLGNGKVIDGVVHDGLWDPYNDQHMGMCGEACAESFGFSRQDQDAYAIQSYQRAADATALGKFKDEMVPFPVPQKRGAGPIMVETDEEIKNTKIDKIPSLRPAFKKDGTITAANASSLNDGAAALVLMSAEKAKQLGLVPLARIRGFGDAAKAPIDFTTAPSEAVPVALKHSGLSLQDIEYHEINEAFANVVLANMELMNLDNDRVNVNGGAIALGHPIGMSGARIVGTLYHVLKQNDATLGCASICNGGGGAGAMIIERLI